MPEPRGPVIFRPIIYRQNPHPLEVRVFAIAAVIVFALALILDLADVALDFPWVLLGLLLVACHLAFGGYVASRFGGRA
jgi:hypothetical protein